MIDQNTLEQKRVEAQQYRGVTYDSRINRFTATITVNGERRYLGSFPTAEEASFEYDQAREANPIFRERKGVAKTIRQILIEFDETAQRDNTKHNNITAGQMCTLPGGQRFRLEGFKFVHGKGWYVWSAACRYCGETFEQYTMLNLRMVKSMNRNCKTDVKRVGRRPGAPEQWPEPAEWKKVPAISPAADAALSAVKKAALNRVEPLPDTWKDRKPIWDFATQHRVRFPLSTLDDIKDAYAEVLSAALPSARQEDTVALAEDTTKEINNEDLL